MNVMSILALTVVLLVMSFGFVDSRRRLEEGNSVMLWMCLQRCGGTPETIAQNLIQIARYPGIFTAVSYEAYNLGPNSTLVIDTDVSTVEPELKLLGTFPLTMCVFALAIIRGPIRVL